MYIYNYNIYIYIIAILEPGVKKTLGVQCSKFDSIFDLVQPSTETQWLGRFLEKVTHRHLAEELKGAAVPWFGIEKGGYWGRIRITPIGFM